MSKKKRIYKAAHGWRIIRDPLWFNGACLFVAYRGKYERFEAKGFDKVREARAWCATQPAREGARCGS